MLSIVVRSESATAQALVAPGETWSVPLERGPLALAHQLDPRGALQLIVQLATGTKPIVVSTGLGREVLLTDGCRRPLRVTASVPAAR
ncbi:MAG: hypothetical protein ACOZQL_15540 [Myxococcota bacterium]